jgi:iron complex outermembrane receptor protein
VGVSVYAPELHKGTTTDGTDTYDLTFLWLFKISFEYVGYNNQPKPLL